jgi:hypothetical protein
MATDRPACGYCGEGLFRSAAKGTTVPKGAPYAVCRNSECPGKVKKPLKDKPRQRRAPFDPTAESKQPATTPADRIEDNRQKVRAFLDMVAKGYDETSIALVLALACQETGNLEAAGVLAMKHRLSKVGFRLPD